MGILKASKLTIEQKELLRKKLELESVPNWNPEANEEIFGVIGGIESKTFRTERGVDQLNVALINTDTGFYRVWLSTVLQRKFDELEIKEGDLVAIKYNGKKKNYRDYTVVIL